MRGPLAFGMCRIRCEAPPSPSSPDPRPSSDRAVTIRGPSITIPSLGTSSRVGIVLQLGTGHRFRVAAEDDVVPRPACWCDGSRRFCGRLGGSSASRWMLGVEPSCLMTRYVEQLTHPLAFSQRKGLPTRTGRRARCNALILSGDRLAAAFLRLEFERDRPFQLTDRAVFFRSRSKVQNVPTVDRSIYRRFGDEFSRYRAKITCDGSTRSAGWWGMATRRACNLPDSELGHGRAGSCAVRS